MLENRPTLQSYLDAWTDQDQVRGAVAETIVSIANTAIAIAGLIQDGPLVGELGAAVGANTDSDAQKAPEVRVNELLLAALRHAPVAIVGSAQANAGVVLKANAPLTVAIDPLDGSSNMDTNVSIGTIFSILATATASGTEPGASLLERGDNQLAAGFVIYGPRTALVLTVLGRVDMFVLDRKTSDFVLTRPNVRIPSGNSGNAFSASDYRYRDRPVRAYIDDGVGSDRNPRANNFNRRWTSSLVAEAFRILSRGGIFPCPWNTGPGYEAGRLRHVCAANPIALIIEQAGGAATDGTRRLLDIEPSTIHDRVPFVFGSRDQVERVVRYRTEGDDDSSKAPLFRERGLFQN